MSFDDLPKPPRGRRRRILAPQVHLSSFITRDFETLRREYDLVTADCRSLAGILRATALVPWVDGVFCWFGSTRFLPVVLAARGLGRKVVIVAGGYDATSVPEIGYGNMRHPVHRIFARLVFRMAHVVACVSRSIRAELLENVALPPERVRLIFHGFDDGGTTSGGSKERLVLTVARIDSSTIWRKGLLVAAQVSRLIPDVPFVFVGPSEPAALARLREVAGPNAAFTGLVSSEDLHQLYRRAAVYLQPSLHEAFGCSIAEAMLHDCVPVVSPRFSLPEVVGGAGLYAEPDDVQGLVAAVRRALDGNACLAESPRRRIEREFPAARRRELLLGLLDEVFMAPSPDGASSRC